MHVSSTDRPTGVPLARDLARFGDAPAVVAGGRSLSYADLAVRVETRRAALGETRRLVLVAGGNDLETLTTYLAALSGGHPVLLAPGDDRRLMGELVARYDPDVLATGGPVHTIEERRIGTVHRLHPGLALLLSTSGSTGSPKLVRLSVDNVQSNADAIAQYLDLGPGERAATTLPLHYCYGLSVVHSHLAAGGCLVLTDGSVVDACFWDLVRRERVTSFAGVPYTFDLLDRVGFARMQLPQLRYLTQAGGRMPPEQVRRFAELGRASGWDLVVMYGQTEATARMAFLPPDLARSRPEAIGVAIPGGRLRVDAADGEPGELVYSGPNVMLGYAERPADLALGRTTHELRTGDLARVASDGLVEVVGRSNRVAKVLGLRVDLDRVERLLRDDGFVAGCTGAEQRLVVAAEVFETAPVRDAVRRRTGLPSWSVEVIGVPALPRTPSGKPCYSAIAGLPRTSPAPASVPAVESPAPARPAAEGVDTGRLRALYAELLDRDDVDDDSSFVTLRGDSLSYVEVSLRLEQLLGTLPADWHTASIAELAAAAEQRAGGDEQPGRTAGRTRQGTDARRRGPDRARGRRVETNVLLRAVAIVIVVGSHANLFALAGGAHALLAAAGYNMGRFHLVDAPRTDRLRHLVLSVVRVVIPSVLVIGSVSVVTGAYPWSTVLLLNGVLGPDQWAEPEWYFWFIEAIVWALVAVTAVLAVPAIHRWERAQPFWVAVAFVAVGLLPRYGVLGPGEGADRIHAASVVFWIFALGWAAAKATRLHHRVVVSAISVATLPGFFDDPWREATVVAGLLLLVWVPSVRLPTVVVPLVGTLASASLYIYLTHWQVYPSLEHRWPLLALLSSLAVGVLVSRLLGPLTSRLSRAIAGPRLGEHERQLVRVRGAVRRRRKGRDHQPVPSGDAQRTDTADVGRTH